MSKLAKVLDNATFRKPNPVRIEAFRHLELPLAENLSILQKQREKNSTKLHDQIKKTAQILRYNIEVAEEGNSKAVLVFTLVTIIFLPLSFVASLFGMNTADMRNIENNQSIF
jgi:Mg2+ and Co2+ transporter CorA